MRQQNNTAGYLILLLYTAVLSCTNAPIESMSDQLADVVGDEASDHGIIDDVESIHDASIPESADLGMTESVDANLDQMMMRNPPAYLGGNRPTTYALPYDYQPGQLLPLVISMHGFGGNAAWHDAYWSLSSVTKEMGVLLLMPNGRKDLDQRQFWSATQACCNFHGAPDTDSDYLRALIEEAMLYFNIDTERIAVVGHSNGGFMSYRTACDHADLITHVAALAGTTWYDSERCQPEEPVSIYQLHGTWDTVIRFAGRDLTLTAEINALQCQREACNEALTICVSNPSCFGLIQCLNGCGFAPTQQDCRDICMISAGELARLDWTDLFICTLNAGCYDSSYGYFGPYPGAESTIQWWSAHNDCRGSTILDNIDLDWSLPGDETKLAEFNRCARGTSVRLARIERGSHSPLFDENFAAHLINWFLNSPRQLDAN